MRIILTLLFILGLTYAGAQTLGPGSGGAPTASPTFTGLVTLPNGTAANPGTGFANSATTGFFTTGAGNLGWSSVGVSKFDYGITSGAALTISGTMVATASTFTVASSAQTYVSTGTVPTGNTGSCNTGITVAGGATAGTWTSTAICALAGTIILTGMPVVTTGYSCDMSDRTTAGVTINQSATTTTTATFIVRALPTGSIATVANDILQYKCMAY